MPIAAISSRRSLIPSIPYKMEDHAPTSTIDNDLPSQQEPTITEKDNLIKKRQAAGSVVHVTITEAGTVIYTHTATSYSYVPTYSTISEPGNNNNGSSASNNGSGNSSGDNDGRSGTNIGAIVGGVVGGVAFIALIALGFFLLRKRKRAKQTLVLQQGGYIDDNGSYYHGIAGNRGSTGVGAGAGNMISLSNNQPLPRHLVAPMAGLHVGSEREGNGRDSKYFSHEGGGGGGYYDDVSPYQKSAAVAGTYYNSTNTNNSNSVAGSDSLPSTTVDNGGYISPVFGTTNDGRHVPNEVDNSTTTISNNAFYNTSRSPTPPEERHVPHLKETIEEPPHSKD